MPEANGWSAMELQRREGYAPGLIAGMLEGHMAYYGPHWGFGAVFETRLATQMATFFHSYLEGRDLALSIWRDGRVAGSICIDGSQRDGTGAHLRWFVLDPVLRGAGHGRALLAEALGFVDAGPHRLTWLTTFAGLDAAAHLYSAAGFVLRGETALDQWQGGVREQRWERGLG
ncbi:MAG: GNAT family N-acetyltransferase [Pseudomonadota bacterium]